MWDLGVSLQGLHVELLLVGNNVPSSELLDHRRYGLILVPDKKRNG